MSLLEALVALALLAGVAVAFVEAMRAAIVATGRLAAADRAVEAELNATLALRAIDPLARPEGNLDLGPYRVAWTTLATGPINALREASGATDRTRAALVDLEVAVTANQDRELVRFRQRRLGFVVDDRVAP